MTTMTYVAAFVLMSSALADFTKELVKGEKYSPVKFLWAGIEILAVAKILAEMR